MIELFEGRLGGGKTYTAVVRMVTHLSHGGTIITNVEIIPDAIRKFVETRYGVHLEEEQVLKLTDQEIKLFHRHIPLSDGSMNLLVVIDEAHLHFNARDWQGGDSKEAKDGHREMLAFLTQSRKFHCDVIFISQSVLNMDKQFMRLVQYIWRFRDMSRWKIPGLGIAYPLNQILAVQFDYDGKTMLNRQFVFKDRKVFGLYNTLALLGKQMERLRTEKESAKIGKLKLRKVQKQESTMTKIILPFLIVVGVICMYVMYSKMKDIGKPVGPTTAMAQVERTTPAPIKLASKRDEIENAKAKQAYDIYAENFVRWDGTEHTLKTDGGWYVAGEMSDKGYVQAVSSRRAKIFQPDGRTAWVVAGDPPPGTPRPEPTPYGEKPSPSPSPGTPMKESEERYLSRSEFNARTIGRGNGGVPVGAPAGVSLIPSPTPGSTPFGLQPPNIIR